MATNRKLFLDASVTANRVEQIVDRQLERVGIPGFLLALLTHVRDLQPVTPSRLAASSGAPVTTLRDNIQRLVDRRLVRRVPNPADGRSYLLTLTARGRRMTQAADPALLEAYLDLESRLPRPLVHYECVLDELNLALADVLGPADAPEATAPARSPRAQRRATPSPTTASTRRA